MMQAGGRGLRDEATADTDILGWVWGDIHYPAQSHTHPAAQWIWHIEPDALPSFPRSHCPCHALSLTLPHC